MLGRCSGPEHNITSWFKTSWSNLDRHDWKNIFLVDKYHFFKILWTNNTKVKVLIKISFDDSAMNEKLQWFNHERETLTIQPWKRNFNDTAMKEKLQWYLQVKVTKLTWFMASTITRVGFVLGLDSRELDNWTSESKSLTTSFYRKSNITFISSIFLVLV